MTDTTATNNKDTFLSSLDSNTNFGGGPGLTVRNLIIDKRNTLIQFTLPSGTGTISKISLYCYGTEQGQGSITVEVHELTGHTDWGETTATWNNYDGTNPWTSAGGDYSATVIATNAWTLNEAAFKNFDLMGGSAINPLTLDWDDEVNLALISSNLVTDLDIASKSNATNSHRPYIEITYGDNNTNFLMVF